MLCIQRFHSIANAGNGLVKIKSKFVNYKVKILRF